MNNRNAKAVLLLSVVVPLGLLMAFKFGGLLEESAGISYTLNLDPVRWELERPYGSFALDPEYEAMSFFSDKEISVRLEATPRDYDEDDDWANGADVLSQRVVANISVNGGFLRNLNIVSTDKSQLVKVSFPSSNGYDGAERRSLRTDSSASISDNWWLLQGDTKAFVNMTGLDRPNSVFFDERLDCRLLGTQNQTHEMRLTFEVIYFNGTAYKRLVQPFDFKISRDSNDSFETAQEITAGYFERLYIGKYDLHDFYKISVFDDQELSIAVNATSSPPPIFSVSLYDSAQNKIEVSNDHPFDYKAAFTFTANSTGLIFLQICPYRESGGFYSIKVDPA